MNRCVEVPSLIAAHSVGQNSGPIFRPLWTKVYRINSLPVRECHNLQRHFPIDNVLLHFEDIRDQVATLCEIALKF